MEEMYQNELDKLRLEIQMIDSDILRLLEERVSTAKVIGQIKKCYNMPVYVPEVEKKKIETLSSRCQYPGLVEAIWPVIMCYTRTVE